MISGAFQVGETVIGQFSTSTNNTVDMSNLTAGTYVYKIISSTGFATGKLMKK